MIIRINLKTLVDNVKDDKIENKLLEKENKHGEIVVES